MDKILAFSILSSSPADISAAGLSSSSSARLSWRPRPQAAAADAAPTPRQEKAADQRAPPAERRREARPRFRYKVWSDASLAFNCGRRWNLGEVPMNVITFDSTLKLLCSSSSSTKSQWWWFFFGGETINKQKVDDGFVVY
ncbi:hypothetical protein Zm00014a_014403 [Zea mays]|uniref:Uncharacterized protein n=1 Tax=Zea mays TaxID=4577 RepID=A0A3L6DFC6_MAIZE|nr:hypothetical protein Zm00014a_014403 [Zea mays]